jgi:hypothetical protein
MARKLSTGLRNALLGTTISITGTGISGVSGTKTIADTGNGFTGLLPGDIVSVSTALIAAGYGTVVTVAAAGGSFTVAETVLDQAAGASYTVTLLNSRSLKQLMANGVIRIYSGAQPADADAAETGDLLVTITVSSGAHTPGIATNGLEFGEAAAGALAKAVAEVWSGVVAIGGTAGWFRFYSNSVDTGISTTAIRFDGSCSTSGAQLNMSSTSLVLATTTTVDTFSVSLTA